MVSGKVLAVACAFACAYQIPICACLYVTFVGTVWRGGRTITAYNNFRHTSINSLASVSCSSFRMNMCTVCGRPLFSSHFPLPRSRIQRVHYHRFRVKTTWPESKATYLRKLVTGKLGLEHVLLIFAQVFSISRARITYRE